MLTLDSRTLMIVIFFLTLLIGVSLLIIAGHGNTRAAQKSMRTWGLAYLLQTFGWLFIGLEKHIPDVLSIVAANALLLCSAAEIYQALRIFDGQAPRRKLTYGLIGLGLALCGAIFFIPGSMPARIAIISCVAFVFFMLSGMQLFRPPEGSPSAIRHILGGGFAILAMIYLLRSILTFSPGAAIPSLLANTPLQTLVFGGTAMGVMVISIGYLLLCTESFNSALIRLATIDDLTGLFNRRTIEQLTRAEMERTRRSGLPLAFLLMDADDFKAINDTYGHPAGDAALQVIADALKMNVRASEIVARLGGDEFAVLLPNTPEPLARQIAGRLAEAVAAAPIYADGQQIPLSMSYGIGMYQSGDPDFSQLMHRADRAMYEMKRCQKEAIHPVSG